MKKIYFLNPFCYNRWQERISYQEILSEPVVVGARWLRDKCGAFGILMKNNEVIN